MFGIIFRINVCIEEIILNMGVCNQEELYLNGCH